MYLLPKYSNGACLLSIYTVRGDCYRYIIEIYKCNIVKYIDEINRSYYKVYELCMNDMDIPLSDSTSAIIKYTIYLYEICGQKSLAITEAQKWYIYVTKDVNNINTNLSKNLKVLKDNIDEWSHKELIINSLTKHYSFSK